MTPFRVDVGDDVLDDLRHRVAAVRWPEPATSAGWEQGVPLDYLQELAAYWHDVYDWRSVEERLNLLPQYRVEIDGLGIHAVHVRSPHAEAVPLLITHGWPGSVLEFLKVIGPLVDPPAHGGDAADAFHVVCPSLPGYGFSDRPSEPGWGVTRIASAWVELMARFGYDRFGAQGGDWGAAVTTRLAQHYPEPLLGIHLNMALAPLHELDKLGDLADGERAILDDYARFNRHDSGYVRIQSTRPQTLGYALADSPVALCAWIVEKFWSWTDCDGHPENVLTRDELLDDVTLYWVTNTGTSAARLYRESYGDIDYAPIGVPAGCSVFPKELRRISRRLAERQFTDLRHFNELERGGHFPSLEQPEVFVEEVRTFFRSVR